jgi:hypothetical protein
MTSQVSNKQEDAIIVFTAYSKKNFYLKNKISRFVFNADKIPISPFMLFGYFLYDEGSIENKIRNANNTLIKNSQELWVFGEISNGVKAEIELAKSLNIPIMYFKINKRFFVNITKSQEEINKLYKRGEEDDRQDSTNRE